VSTDGSLAVIWLRHCSPVAEKQSTSKVTLPHNRNRLAKRKRAMQACNSPRNSQPETHPDDERGRRRLCRGPHRMDRFPDALENSYRKPLRSGKLVSPGREMGFEFSGRQIAERRVKPPLVIQFFEKLADRSFRFTQVPIFITQDLFVFQRFYERLTSGVVPWIAFARHADCDSIRLE